MKVIEGIKKIQHHFPGVSLWRYLNPVQNDTLAQRMHMAGECIVNNREDLIKLMDNLGLAIYRSEFIKLH